jgi:signal recognition particle receptor subunit beta
MTPLSEISAEVVAPTWPECMRLGMGPMRELRNTFEELQETLQDIEAIGGDVVAKKTRRMSQELDSFAPAVTFIGQIKSGKTTLVNALAGHPGLLPADVNPWTSVVTSIHLNMPRPAGSPVASFQFFDSDEWDHLVQNGGRMGELSARAGADKEFEKLQKQIAEMRENTKARLGRKFELLLGQTHDYQKLEVGLVQKYVCLGDNFDLANAEDRQGQFADITRSADIYLDAPTLPHALTVRDTPGMNDTFMMREQVTIRAIRDSKICCVVLSAHQALNAVDMGLIRLISTVKSRQVVIFVNRIDELSDPAAQVPEIRASLIKTLEDNNGPEDPTILFGSAYWANAVISGEVDELPEASQKALQNYADRTVIPGFRSMDEDEQIWSLSGLPALYEALGERIAESAGEKALVGVRRRAANMVAGLRASSSIVSLKANSNELQKMSPMEVREMMLRIETQAQIKMKAALDGVFNAFEDRIDQAHSRFVGRALDALLLHLEKNGEDQVWNYSPDGLRMLMRTAYQVMRRNFQKQVSFVFEETADTLTEAYGEIFDVTQSNFVVAAPTLPDTVPLAAVIDLRRHRDCRPVLR